MANMAGTVLASGLLLLLFHAGASQFGKPESRVPIGAIFDNDAKEVRSAFSYEIMEINNELQSRVKLDSNSQRIYTNDSYALTTTMCSLMANGVMALFGLHGARTQNTVKTFTDTFQMPYVSPSTALNSTKQDQGFMMYMRPLYSKAVLDVIRHYGWGKVYYFYQNDDGLLRLEQLFDEIVYEDIALHVKVYKVRDANHAYDTLIAIDRVKEDAGDKRVLLDMPSHMCQDLLVSQKTDTRRTRFHYFVTGLGMGEMAIPDYRNGGINITGFDLVDFGNQTVRQFLKKWNGLDGSSWKGAGTNKISYEAALAVDSVQLISRTLGYLHARRPEIFRNTLKHGKFYNNGTEGIDCDSEPAIPWTYGPLIMKTMKETEMYGLSGKIAFDNHGLRRGYKLDVMEVNFNRGMAKIGVWSQERRLVNQSPSLVRQKGNNTLLNRTRIVTSILTEPYLMLRESSGEGKPLVGNDQFEGYCADLAKKIAEIIKIQYIISPVKDGKYGGMDENGTWNGIVGEIIRNEADLAIAPLTITSSRERVIDFSKPFMSLGISIMIKRPTKQSPGVFSFMYPLSYEIWMCVIFAYIGVSVVLFLVSRFSPFEWHIEDNTDGPTITNNFTIFNSLWFSLGAFMQQGCDIEPRSLSGRIVGSVWWFFTLIIISSYTANLAAFLTTSRMQSPIESADDLAKQTVIKYGTVEGGSTMAFFKQSTIPVYQRMWAFMSSAEPSVFVKSNEEGVQRVREFNGRYAFLTESTTNDYINQRMPCDTMKVGSNLDSKGYGIGTPLGSDLRDRVTLAVLELRENGELQKLEKKWWYDKGECGKDIQGTKQKDTTNALKLPNVAGIFYILVGGLVLALVMAVVEFLYKSKMEARRRKYTYAPAAQLISLDGYVDGNTHTQV